VGICETEMILLATLYGVGWEENRRFGVTSVMPRLQTPDPVDIRAADWSMNVSRDLQVHVSTDRSHTYAMKKLKKFHIVNTRQQEHVMNEKTIMLDCHCDFIARFISLLITITGSAS